MLSRHRASFVPVRRLASSWNESKRRLYSQVHASENYLLEVPTGQDVKFDQSRLFSYFYKVDEMSTYKSALTLDSSQIEEIENERVNSPVGRAVVSLSSSLLAQPRWRRTSLDHKSTDRPRQSPMPTLQPPVGPSKEQLLYMMTLEREGDYDSLVACVAEMRNQRRHFSPSEILQAYKDRDERVLQFVLQPHQ